MPLPIPAVVPVLRAIEEHQLAERSSGPRIYQLDALRGLAALTVVAYHISLVEYNSRQTWATNPLLAGNQAVTLFFVLSGFVLSLPYWRVGAPRRTTRYHIYLLRRCIRIYLPFAAAALLSILGAWLFQAHSPRLSIWFNQTWHTHITWALIYKQFLMWPLLNFNTAFWSLRYEMQLSIVMPLIAWTLRRRTAALVLLVSLTIAFASIHGIMSLNRLHMLGTTIQVASLFVLGATTALYQVKLRALLSRMRSWAWLVLFGSLCLYYDYPSRIPGAIFVDHFKPRNMLIAGIGAAGIILCALEMKPFAALLKHGIVDLGASHTACILSTALSYLLYLT